MSFLIARCLTPAPHGPLIEMLKERNEGFDLQTAIEMEKRLMHESRPEDENETDFDLILFTL